MKTYKIIATSWALWIPTLFIPPLIGALISFKLFRDNDTIGIILLLSLLIFALYIQRFISRAEVEVGLTDNNISIKWVKQFIFHNREDREISLHEIESYKYQEDRNFDLFKLTLKDGSEIKLWHFTFTNGDDFGKLVADFPKITNQKNKKTNKKNKVEEPDTTHIIKREKTIFESAVAPFIAGFAIIVIIILILTLFDSRSGKFSNNVGRVAAISGAVFFIFKYFEYRKKKND